MPTAAVNLLSERDYAMIQAFAPHDTDVRLPVWTAFLSRMLGRTVSETQTVSLIGAYNARRRREAA